MLGLRISIQCLSVLFPEPLEDTYAELLNAQGILLSLDDVPGGRRAGGRCVGGSPLTWQYRALQPGCDSNVKPDAQGVAVLRQLPESQARRHGRISAGRRLQMSGSFWPFWFCCEAQ